MLFQWRHWEIDMCALTDNDGQNFIFSSTAAIFGIPTKVPIEEDDTQLPINPYGETKLAVERILHWCDQAYGIKSACLRYFNACGADASGEIGEDHACETHLIPLILQVALGKRNEVTVFGNDYPTSDGTCVRDYIHVTDLSSAHIKALDYLMEKNQSVRFNLGCGKGYTVQEIISAARKVTGHPLPMVVKGRRPGDPPSLIASSSKAEHVLNWKREYTTIESIVASAWQFHQKHPNGY
jgi:UDP-glucose 4-epimerase